MCSTCIKIVVYVCVSILFLELQNMYSCLIILLTRKYINLTNIAKNNLYKKLPLTSYKFTNYKSKNRSIAHKKLGILTFNLKREWNIEMPNMGVLFHQIAMLIKDYGPLFMR